MRLLCVLILILLLPACATTTAQINSAAQHRQKAQESLSSNDKQGAIAELGLALHDNPNIGDALLYADLLESQKDYIKARKIYKKAFRYPADAQQKATLNYRLALLEAGDFDNLKVARKLASALPDGSRLLDLQSVMSFKQGDYRQALNESQSALTRARDNEEKGWAYFHMALIYYALRIEQDTFRALFEATNNGRGYALVARITEYWEAKRHETFPVD